MKGIFAAVPTPFDDADEIDVPALRRLVRHLLEGGVHGLWALGAGGEFAGLREHDRRTVIETIVNQVGGRIPVIAGTAAAGTAQACVAARQASEWGADAVSALAPYFYSCDETELLDHFRAVAAASPLSVVLYNNPHNTRVNLPAHVVGKLASDPKFIGVKDSSTNWEHFCSILTSAPRDGSFRVFQGDETAVASSLVKGADGAIIAVPVLAPALCAKLYKAAISGEAWISRDLQATVSGLLDVYTVLGRSGDTNFLAGQKAALELMGLCTRRVALPGRAANDDEMIRVAAVLKKYRLLPAPAEQSAV